MEEIRTLLLKMGEIIAQGLPIADVIADQLLIDYKKLYTDAGYPFGDTEEGLCQYIRSTKIVLEGED